MKLRDYANKLGLTYRTAWNHFNAGLIDGAYKIPNGTIIVPEKQLDEKKEEYGVILYARTSSSQNKKMLEEQSKRLESYAIARGYKIKKTIKEFGSGLNDSRKQLTTILKENKYDKIIVEHKDRLTRFGFEWFRLLTNDRIEVINENKEKDEDLAQDFIAIIHSFSARLYGQIKSKRIQLEIKKSLNKE